MRFGGGRICERVEEKGGSFGKEKGAGDAEGR